MTQELWTSVDNYFSGLLVPEDTALKQTIASSAAGGLPAIQVSAVQGKLLHLLARMIPARKILEIGTLGGYSTIWMARALPDDGRVITLEADAKHAEVAQKNFERAGVESKVELRLGKALDTLPQIAAQACGPFDLIFIDANRSNMPEYFEWSLRLARPGTLIIADNVVRSGRVIEESSDDPEIEGVRRFAELASKEKRVSATALQTVGGKGYDGLALLLVNR
jgi:predicted O-methyltransferase YrrM